MLTLASGPRGRFHICLETKGNDVTRSKGECENLNVVIYSGKYRMFFPTHKIFKTALLYLEQEKPLTTQRFLDN